MTSQQDHNQGQDPTPWWTADQQEPLFGTRPSAQNPAPPGNVAAGGTDGRRSRLERKPPAGPPVDGTWPGAAPWLTAFGGVAFLVLGLLLVTFGYQHAASGVDAAAHDNRCTAQQTTDCLVAQTGTVTRTRETRRTDEGTRTTTTFTFVPATSDADRTSQNARTRGPRVPEQDVATYYHQDTELYPTVNEQVTALAWGGRVVALELTPGHVITTAAGHEGWPWRNVFAFAPLIVFGLLLLSIGILHTRPGGPQRLGVAPVPPAPWARSREQVLVVNNRIYDARRARLGRFLVWAAIDLTFAIGAWWAWRFTVGMDFDQQWGQGAALVFAAAGALLLPKMLADPAGPVTAPAGGPPR